MTVSATPGRAGIILKGLGLVLAGALAALALGGLRPDGWRLLHAGLGSDALAEACRAPLARRLAERGFEPEEVEFGPEPTTGPPWGRERSFGASFTFRDGAAALRVDGVMACVVSGESVTVEFRVSSSPRRAA